MHLATKELPHVPVKRLPAPGRMSLANVTRGKQEKPFRVLIYGVEGVGKSTFAAAAPDPIFLCAEDGTAHLDVARFPVPATWADALEAVRVLTYEKHTYGTLVIDTLDWLEPLCWQHVCTLAGKATIEDFGFGKGYVAALDHWRQLVARLDVLSRTRGTHVVLVAHAAIRRVDDPYAGAFDRYRMKLHERAADLLREWADAVLFARHERLAVEKKGNLPSLASGARLLHTQWTAAYDAKNRFDLPETLPLDWDDFAVAARTHAPAGRDELRRQIVALLPRLPDRVKAERALAEWAGDNPARLAHLLDKIRGKLALLSAESDGNEEAEAQTTSEEERRAS